MWFLSWPNPSQRHTRIIPQRLTNDLVVQVFKELPHRTGCILWFGDVSLWWNNTSSTVRATFESLVSQMDPSLPVLYLGTSKEEELPHQVENLFKKRLNEVYVIPEPASGSRETFFRPLFRIKALKPPPKPKPKKEEMEPLLEAPPTPPPKLTEEQLEALHKEEENTLRELRIFLRQCCAKLARNKAFYMFSRPVDIKEVPDYLQVIKEPMDLETMMTKIDHLEYNCAEDFLRDIDLMCSNALEYNPDRDPADKQIRHRACYLRDTAYALIKAEMDSDFEVTCRQIRDERKRRLQAADPSAENKTENHLSNETETDMVGIADKTSAENSKNNSSQGSSSSLVRKKRRKCMWQKGMVKKPRKHSVESNHSQPGPSSKPDGASCSSSKRHSTMDSKEDVTLNDSIESESKLPNGYLTAATEDSADETPGTPKKVLVDREALNNLLAEAVRVTAGHNVERLVDLHGTLSRVIDTYADKWDRTSLVKALRDRLSEFEEDTNDD